MESFLAELPEWARTLFYIVFAVGSAVFFLYRRNMPMKPGETTSQTYELRAAMVDSRAVEALSNEVHGQTAAIGEQTRVLRDLIAFGERYRRDREDEEERRILREKDDAVQEARRLREMIDDLKRSNRRQT